MQSDALRVLARAAIILGLALAAYWPALRSELLWDDAAHVTRAEMQPGSGLRRIWTDLGATQQYYPVLHSAFWVEHRLWGDRTAGYHLLNLLLHMGASLLLVRLLHRLWEPGRSRGGGVPAGAEWLAGAIFALHPVCVESVAWISEQKNTLSLVFYLLSALAYLGFDQSRRPGTYGLALALYLLALATKSVTATLPAALLIVLWWQRGRLSWRRDVLPLAPWLALGIAAGLLTASVERNVIRASGPEFDLAFGERVMLAGRVIWFYLGKLAWPTNLTFIYPHWDVAASARGWIGWLLAAAAVTAGLWWLRERNRGLLTGWLFFVGSLFPVLGFLNVYPFRYSYVADHFQYLPSLGMIALSAAGAAMAFERVRPAFASAGRASGVVLVATLAILTHRQAQDYRDGATLYRATIARNPACWMAHNNLAELLSKSPDCAAEAIAHYREALRIKPDCAEAHYNLANSLAELPDGGPEALEHYRQALRARPDYPEAHNNFANELAKLPDGLPEALVHYEAALRLKPDNAETHNNLATALGGLPGRAPEAVAHFEEALRIRPDFVEAHLNLASLLATMPGREPEAVAHYQEALRLGPGNAPAHNNLAGVLANLPGRIPEAIVNFEEAIRLQPEFADAQVNLASLLAAIPGREPEAIAHYETALRIRPDDAEARRELALLRARLRSGR